MRNTAIVLAAVALTVGVAHAANALENGGFEDGDLTAWTHVDWTGGSFNDPFVTGVDPADGTYHLRVNGVGDRIHQVVDGTGARTGDISFTVDSKDHGSIGQKYDVTIYGLDAGYTLDAGGRPDTGGTQLLQAEAFLLDTYAGRWDEEGNNPPGSGLYTVNVAQTYDSYMLYFWFAGSSENNDYDNFLLEIPGLGETLMPGDTDDDGDVDLDDLFAMRNNFGMGSGATRADGDVAPHPAGDGDVDLDDLFMVRNNFGMGLAVPEPATLSLLAVGAIAVLRRRKR